MTEDLVEKLTPPKEMAETDPEERIKILDGIAEVCMQQGQYHLATKKYTQAGNKVKVSAPSIAHLLCGFVQVQLTGQSLWRVMLHQSIMKGLGG